MAKTTTPEDARISEALAKLRCSIDVPPVDPARERSLLDAFDAHWAPRRPRASRWAWSAAAALTAIVVALNWIVARQTSAIDPGDVAPVETAANATGFVAWPGAEAWPPFESGWLVRVDLPVSTLSALGLSVPFLSTGVVQAEIVIGQDGFARAVRLAE